MFRKTIVRNRLQNIMLELYDKIQRKVSSQCPTTSNRQMELFHRFVFLVHDYCIEEREVSFYDNYRYGCFLRTVFADI